MRWWRASLEYLGVTVGSLLIALGLVWFLIPNRIAAGGVSGLATVFFHLFGWPVGLAMLMLNVPLFLGGFIQLGMRFGLRTLWGTIALSFFVDLLTPFLAVLTRDALLAAIYGGVLVGVGLGLVFRFQATTGGTDLAAQLVRRFLRTSAGEALLVIDGVVIVLAGLVFNLELALYGIISIFVSTRLLDLVLGNAGYTKAALIISDQAETIGQAILRELDRGVTALHGQGMYTGQEREILLVVIGRSEVSRLKALVARHDSRAFVILSNVQEALGEGFKRFGGEELY